MIGGEGFSSRGLGSSGGGFGRSGRMRLSLQDRRPLQTSAWVVLRRLGGVVAPYRMQLAVALVCVLLTSATQMLMPWAFKQVIDVTIPEGDVRGLVLITAGLVLAQVLRHALTFYERYQVALVSQQAVYRLARDLFEHLQTLSLRFFERWGTGELISRATTDIGVLQSAVSGGTIRAAISTVNMVAYAVVLWLLNWQLALVASLTVPLLYLAGGITAGHLRVRYRRVQERMAEVNNVLQENISGVRVARAFARERDQGRRFHAENRGTLEANLSTAGVQAVATPAVQMISAAGTGAVILFGSWQVVEGRLTVGTLVAFVTYLAQFYQPVEDLFRVNNTIQQALSASERVFELLDERPDVTERPGALDLQRVEGAVAFEGVTFAYEAERPVLRDVSLRGEPGQLTALVGQTGAGKTTLINLIPRFYDPDAGRVTLDGHDLRDLTLASLRRQTAVVLQETVLFGASVADNIRYGRLDATDEEVAAAARQAYVDEFIAALPEGYDSWCGEGGALLSRGQRQRISLARAILKDPRVLILDEATSDVDTETERLIQRALEAVMRGRTSFVIAHRLSTVRHADRIVVLDQGRIVEAGRHEALLAAGGAYAALYRAQFADQEAAQAHIDALAAPGTTPGVAPSASLSVT